MGAILTSDAATTCTSLGTKKLVTLFLRPLLFGSANFLAMHEATSYFLNFSQFQAGSSNTFTRAKKAGGRKAMHTEPMNSCCIAKKSQDQQSSTISIGIR